MEIEHTYSWRYQAALESNHFDQVVKKEKQMTKEELISHLEVSRFTLQKSQNDLLMIFKSKMTPDQYPLALKRLNDLVDALEKLKSYVETQQDF